MSNMGSKRRRLALSCVACRRRKVKCGRELPACVRCIRSGNEEGCKYIPYDDGTGEELSHITNANGDDSRQGSSPALSWNEEAETWHQTSKAANTEMILRGAPRKRDTAPKSIAGLQERVFELETYVRTAGSKPVSSEKYFGMGNPFGPGASSHKNGLQEFERSLLRGNSFKTQYFGPSHSFSLLLQFPELATMIKEILARTPAFSTLKEKLKQPREDSDLPSDGKTIRQFQELAAMLPDKERTDALVAAYLETFEMTYRILHVPTFHEQYEKLWTNPEECNQYFVVQLLLVVASVTGIVPGGPSGFVGRSSIARETATRWIEASEVFLDNQSHKHTTLEYYQTHVLLYISKKMNCYKVKREWMEVGKLVRLAMAAGLHREPTYLSSKISPFDQEMRRRLWYTILELEVAASCDRGIRASITTEDWDCLPPLNTEDETFSSATTSMPSSKPQSEFTRTSFLCFAGTHLPLRLQMLGSINSVSSDLEFGTIMGLDGRVREYLDEIPSWPEKTATAFPRQFSRLLLWDYLLLLHQNSATQILGQYKYFFSRSSRRETALNIMRSYTSSPLTHALCLINQRDDVFRASLSTCHDIVVASKSQEDLLQNTQLATDLVEQSVELMAARVRRYGQGFHGYWINSCALSLVNSKMSPSVPKDTFAQEAAERVLKLHADVVRLQQNGRENGTVRSQKKQQKNGNTADLTSMPTIDGNVLPFFDEVSPDDPFSYAMFDFDMPDLWDMGPMAQFDQI